MKSKTVGWNVWPRTLNPYFVLLNLVVNAIWIISFWPGTFTGDSIMVLSQIKTGLWNDWHPIPYTLYYSAITIGGTYVSLGTLIQSILLNISIILFIRSVTQLSFNFAILFTTFLMITPYIGPFSVTAWKDVPYLIFTILGIVEIFKLLSRGVKKSSKKVCIFYLTFGSSMRHDGPTTLFASAVILLIVTFFLMRNSSTKQNKRKIELVSISKTLTWAALLGFVIQVALPSLLNATPKEDAMISMSFLRDLAHVAKTDKSFLDADEYYLIRSYSDGTSWSFADDCVGPNGYLGPMNFDFERAGKHSLDVFDIWLRHFFSGDAIKLLEARSCNLSSFSLPFIFGNKPNQQVLWTACGTAEVAPSDLEAVPTQNNALLMSMNDFLKKGVCGWPKYLGWPSMFYIFGILASCFLFFRTRRIEVLLLGSVILGRTLTLYVFSVAQDFRYALLIHLITITLIVAVLLELFRRPVPAKNRD